jgi:hypothetical protein
MFEVGDVVRLKTGTALQRVTRVSKYQLWTRYIEESQFTQDARRREDFILVSYKTPNPQEDHMATKTLYQIIGTNDFGTFLAKTSDGKIAIEMKPSGVVATYDPKELEEVLPYTVHLVGPRGGNGLHVVAKKDVLKAGDWVLNPQTFELFKVQAVDTRNRKPIEGEWIKLVTESV